MQSSTSWGTGRPAAPSSTSWGAGRPGRRLAAAAVLSIAVGGTALAALPASAASAAPAARHGVSPLATGSPDTGKGWGAANATGAKYAPKQGQGVTVAVLDSGISPVPALAGRVVQGVDLTGDGMQDAYGHGTFVAGLIAGNGLDANGNQTGLAGTAPGARVVSVKVIDDKGESDEQTLANGLIWVLQNRAAYGIDVVNLSLGVDATDKDPANDPVDTLVEALWHAGVVVVVSSGNDGKQVVHAPADDPTVITVGATYVDGDTTTSNDVLAPFTSWGTPSGLAKPEVSVPGVHLQAPLPAGSALAKDQQVSGLPAGYGQMSGTSMAAGVLSGLIADGLSMYPTLTPADVKAKVVGGAQGAARSLNLYAALQTSTAGATDPAASPNLGKLQGALSSAAGQQPKNTTKADGSWNDADWANATYSNVVWSRTVWSNVVWSRTVWSSSVWSRSVWSRVLSASC